MSDNFFLNPTPIDIVDVGGFPVLVKREDLCLHGDPEAPRLAKLRGVYQYLVSKGLHDVAVFDTRVSHAGWGVSYICRALGYPCTCFYTQLKHTQPAPQQMMSQALGSHLYSLHVIPVKDYLAKVGGKKRGMNELDFEDLKFLPGGRGNAHYSRAKRIAQITGKYMLPLGLTLAESVSEHREIAANLPPAKTVVIAIGSGMIAGGVLLGFPGYVIAISPGMDPTQQRERIRKQYSALGLDNLEINFLLLSRLLIIQDPRDYYEPEEEVVAPFPCSSWYDLKAWKWLTEHVHQLKQPVIFYNIGA
jgi:hypothetical protein